MKVERILVPFDFSDHSKRALDHAIGFAKKFEAAIDLLHSYRIHYPGVLPFGDVFPATLYDDVRNAASPDDALLDFLQSTYEAAADLSDWDRMSLEKSQ